MRVLSVSLEHYYDASYRQAAKESKNGALLQSYETFQMRVRHLLLMESVRVTEMQKC